ncbi:uncharacterized protein NPIL_53281 [Nephila pilipes]|uniref:Integrase zinc-binding domain-containing protein n=1 Tax=Nephila pilipes TaxID=299642 RepID=A0A8X6ML82_NEPPI|nr:uncharacterized protein NPIL_53281 [Nephila pilipes]
MVLRKWQIKSVKLREVWRRASIETQEDKTIEVGCGAPTKVLGLAWDPDMVFFDFSKLINILVNGCSTKRFILQIVTSWLAYASVASYGCVVFLRGVTHDNRVIVKFVCSKSRVVPLKSLTLPRLELLGCLLSVRLSKQGSKCLKFEAKLYFCTDSNICAYWIKAPFLDDNNVLRVRGRFEESEFSTNEIHPILLPNQSKFTELLIFRECNKAYHGGVCATLAKIRSRYWMPRGRHTVKKVLKDCLICRKYYLKTAQLITAQLPKNKVLENPPLTVTGIDFTGLNFRSEKDSQQKFYITLFTCVDTRALHNELITDMTTKRFISSLRRFLARWGSCKVVILDNAKSFKTTDNILKEFSKIIVDLD